MESLSTRSGWERFQPNTSPERYQEIVEKAKEYIHAGDIFQVVLSQRVDIPKCQSVHDLSCAPNGQSLAVHVLSRLHRSSDRRRVARTAGPARGRCGHQSPDCRDPSSRRNRERTTQNAGDLWLMKRSGPSTSCWSISAETMSVASRTGNGSCAAMMEIERYSHVMHIVSNVEGQIARS